MPRVVSILLASMTTWFRSRLAMQLELIALRHQIAVYKQSLSQPKLQPSERWLRVWLSRLCPGWQQALEFVQPRTVIAWQKRRFRAYWRRLSQSGQPGRPAISKDVRELIQDGCRSIPLGHCTTLSPPGSRRHLRRLVPVACQEYGHRRSEDCAAQPLANPYCERVIGSMRRDALDHVVVFNEKYLRRVLQSYVEYYHHWRTHRSLDMDAPETRAVQSPVVGPVRRLPEVGGLHHHYERIAA